MKIGILGGTFQPPHVGHLQMACYALDRHHLDQLMIIPTAVPPHKSLPGGASDEDRFTMCKLNFGELEKVEVSDMEMRRKGKSYTILTIAELKEQNPHAEMLLFMGGDMFLSLYTWKEYECLFQEVTLCAFAREEGEMAEIRNFAKELEEKYNAKIILENMPVLPLSSTEIREKIKSGEEVSDLLTPPVLDYIRSHHLYQ